MPVAKDSRPWGLESLTTNNGGADEDRTRDPLLAKQVLSHLSYSPHGNSDPARRPLSGCRPPLRELQAMVGLGRVELPTSRLSGVRSNQLSYRPENEGAEGASRSRKRTPRRFSGKLKRVPLFNWIRPAPHQFLTPSFGIRTEIRTLYS